MPPHPKQTTHTQFLATSASVVAPLILPASAIGRDSQTPPSQRISLGLIALQLGQTATWNGQPMLANPGQDLVNPPPRSEARQDL